MMREADRVVSIPLRVAVIVVLWGAGVALMVLEVVTGCHVFGRWGMLLCIGGATLTVVHAMTRHHRMLRQAFELGQETERARLSSVR